MRHKKAQEGPPGLSSIVKVAVIIVIGISVLIILSRTTGVGWQAIAKIKNIFSFI